MNGIVSAYDFMVWSDCDLDENWWTHSFVQAYDIYRKLDEVSQEFFKRA